MKKKFFMCCFLSFVILNLLSFRGLSQNFNDGKKFTDVTVIEEDSVSANVTPGPFGVFFAPPSLNSVVEFDKTNGEYKFPSFYIDISAKKGRRVKISNNQNSEKEGSEPIEIDYLFQFVAFDENDQPLVLDENKNPYLRIIEWLPRDTKSVEKKSKPAQVAEGIDQVTSVLAPFYPGVSSQANAASKGLSVLFSGLFPPNLKVYDYSYTLDSRVAPGCVGWKLKKDVQSNNSLLGTRRLAVLLQVNSKVKSIKCFYYKYVQWSNTPNFPDKKELSNNLRRCGRSIGLKDRDEVDDQIYCKGFIEKGMINCLCSNDSDKEKSIAQLSLNNEKPELPSYFGYTCEDFDSLPPVINEEIASQIFQFQSPDAFISWVKASKTIGILYEQEVDVKVVNAKTGEFLSENELNKFLISNKKKSKRMMSFFSLKEIKELLCKKEKEK